MGLAETWYGDFTFTGFATTRSPEKRKPGARGWGTIWEEIGKEGERGCGQLRIIYCIIPVLKSGVGLEERGKVEKVKNGLEISSLKEINGQNTHNSCTSLTNRKRGVTDIEKKTFVPE